MNDRIVKTNSIITLYLYLVRDRSFLLIKLQITDTLRECESVLIKKTCLLEQVIKSHISYLILSKRKMYKKIII